jgi:hypothetical protein
VGREKGKDEEESKKADEEDRERILKENSGKLREIFPEEEQGGRSRRKKKARDRKVANRFYECLTCGVKFRTTLDVMIQHARNALAQV